MPANNLPTILIEPNAAGSVPAILDQLEGKINSSGSKTPPLPPVCYHIICDENTHEVLAKKLSFALGADCLIIPNERATPSLETIAWMKTQISLSDHMCFIAVGSGTLNDLTKYFSYLHHFPYIVCGTAPSMNGYASATASLIDQDGVQKSLPAQPPLAVIMDTTIIAQAPLRLIQSGIGDSICRSTAQCDWRFSYLTLRTKYSKEAFDITSKYEEYITANIAALMQRDLTAIEALCHLLVQAGIGMQIAAGSYPASGSEHALVHSLHMLYGRPSPSYFHGEEIAPATLAISKYQAAVLSCKTMPDFLYTSSHTQRHVNETLSQLGKMHPALTHECIAVKTEKESLFRAKIQPYQAKLQSQWNELRSDLLSIHTPPDTIKQIIDEVKLPNDLTQAGFTQSQINTAKTITPISRERWGLLDLVL